MKINASDPRALWDLFSEGQEYKASINLYNTVATNERFYAGDQWHGLNAPDIDKPIVNIIRPAINYMVATIVSDNVAIDITPSIPNDEDERFLDSVKTEVERVREQFDIETLSRNSVRNAAIDADACLYLYWDKSVKTGQRQDGDIRAHLVENTQVLFGNPTCDDPQKQPFIQIAFRDFVEDVREEAIAYGMSEKDAKEKLKADNDSRADAEQKFDKLITKLLTMFKVGDSIHMVISTRNTIIRKEWDSKLTLYPIAWFCWQRSRNSYHGVSIVTEMVPTQIDVNKLIAAYLRCTMLYAWPKIIYNKAIFPNGWDNRIGRNIEVQGNPDDAYAALFPGTGATSDVTNTLDWIMGRVRESSGANDASLGQINSDNTSAIIAAQEANTIPLDFVQRGYFAFHEQIIRIIIDMLAAYAGVRYVALTEAEKKALAAQQIPTTNTFTGIPGEDYSADDADPDMLMQQGELMPDRLYSPAIDGAENIGTIADPANAPEGTKAIDFSKLKELAWNLSVTIGTGSYFSEAIRNSTLTNLVTAGLILPIEYFKRIDDKFVPNKQEIIDRLEKQAAMPTAPSPNDPNAGIPNDESPMPWDSGSVTNAKNYIMGLRPELTGLNQ